MDFNSMLDEIYDNLEDQTRVKMVLPKPDINITTTNTYWKNVKPTLKSIKRGPDHFVSLMNLQVGETNWISGSKSDGVVIIGKIKKDKIVRFLQDYIKKYVFCSVCKSSDTSLSKNNTLRKYQVVCNNCNSTTTV
jgi:translation initiation factor 2 subunit 2